MDDKHDEVDGGVVSEGEHGRYPRAASLDKIVDFCAEEFGKKCVYLICFQYDWHCFFRYLSLFSLHNRQCFDGSPEWNYCGCWLSPPSSNTVAHIGPIRETCHYIVMELLNIGVH